MRKMELRYSSTRWFPFWLVVLLLSLLMAPDRTQAGEQSNTGTSSVTTSDSAPAFLTGDFKSGIVLPLKSVFDIDTPK